MIDNQIENETCECTETDDIVVPRGGVWGSRCLRHAAAQGRSVERGRGSEVTQPHA